MIRKISFIILCQLAWFGLQAQTWTGGTTAVVGQSVTYSFTNGTLYSGIHWVTANGTATSTWSVGSIYYATIVWNSPASPSSLTLLDGSNNGRANTSITVSIGIPVTTFTVVKNCGSTNITRVATPPSGVNWYWQTINTGTSTSSNAATYTVSTAGTYYLRARWGATGAWSTNSLSTAAVTILAQPTPPASPVDGNVISNVASAVPLSAGTVSIATVYNWYNVPTNGTILYSQNAPSTPAYSPTVTTPGTSVDYYVEAVNVTCASATRTKVTARLHPVPVVSATTGGIVNLGQSVTLSVSNYVYDTYAWYDETGNAIAGATSSSYVTNKVGIYKVRVTKANSSAAFSTGQVVSGYNYIVTTDVYVDGKVNDADVAALDVNGKGMAIQYFDGLGRPTESLNWQSSPSKKDVVQPVAYDAFGRESIKYLPFVSTENNGWFKVNPIGTTLANYTSSPQYNFYNNGLSDKIVDDTKPYSESTFETSPLSRPEKAFGPGSDWSVQNKNIQYQYLINVHNTGVSSSQEKIVSWLVDVSGNLTRSAPLAGYVEVDGYYSTGQITIKVIVDEEGNAVREYTNKKGQVILKKVQAVSGSTNLNSLTDWASMYYIYDDLGRLVIVLPPEGVKSILSAFN